MNGINYLGQAIPAGGLPAAQPQQQQNPMMMLAQVLQQMLQPQAQPQGGGLAELIAAIQPKHFGVGGAEMTSENPTGDPRNPFNTGFFKSSAADLSPEQIAQSQGGNAINQWQYGMSGSAPSAVSPQAAAAAASPAPYRLSPDTVDLLRGARPPRDTFGKLLRLPRI